MRSVHSVLRCGLLAASAAGVVAIPVTATLLAQSPMEAAAAARVPAVEVPFDASAHLAAYQATIDSAVAAQMAAASQQVAAEQVQAAQAKAAQEQAEQAEAAQERAAQEQAAQQRASRSRPAGPAPAAAAATGDPRAIARALLAARGQSSQFSCLDRLWSRESGWSTSADNSSSSAYGIPQALPGSKMASAGPDWRTSARTQITWGLSYIADSYGSPCSAWSHSQSYGWY